MPSICDRLCTVITMNCCRCTVGTAPAAHGDPREKGAGHQFPAWDTLSRAHKRCAWQFLTVFSCSGVSLAQYRESGVLHVTQETVP